MRASLRYVWLGCLSLTFADLGGVAAPELLGRPPVLRMPRLRRPVKQPQLEPPKLGTSRVDAAQQVADATSAGSEWELKTVKDSVRVWSRRVPNSPFMEIRGNGLIRASPAAVIGLFESSDADLIRQYNPLYDSGWDLVQHSKTSKVSYGRAASAFPGFKPRDTVTEVSCHKLQDGTVFILRAVSPRAAPPQRTQLTSAARAHANARVRAGGARGDAAAARRRAREDHPRHASHPAGADAQRAHADQLHVRARCDYPIMDE